MIVTRTTRAITRPSREERARLAAMPIGRDAHARAFEACACLHEIELRPPPPPLPAPPECARVVFWNAERLKYPGPSAVLMRDLGADALLLCELDLGMARSGQRHTTADLADALDIGYAFGVEFVELGLGDARERAWHAGEENDDGLHGAAILSPHLLSRPALVRLDRDGAWFDGGFDERRVGGRIAILSTLELEGGPVTLASVHFESHGDPTSRTVEMRSLLEAVEHYAPGQPALIGGDFNTNSGSRGEVRPRERLHALLARDPRRLIDPIAWEPLFEVAAAAGYDWRTANDSAPTQRTRPDGTPPPPLGRLDWFFARGLAVRDAVTVPAIDAAGVAISDHDVLALTIARE